MKQHSSRSRTKRTSQLMRFSRVCTYYLETRDSLESVLTIQRQEILQSLYLLSRDKRFSRVCTYYLETRDSLESVLTIQRHEILQSLYLLSRDKFQLLFVICLWLVFVNCVFSHLFYIFFIIILTFSIDGSLLIRY